MRHLRQGPTSWEENRDCRKKTTSAPQEVTGPPHWRVQILVDEETSSPADRFPPALPTYEAFPRSHSCTGSLASVFQPKARVQKLSQYVLSWNQGQLCNLHTPISSPKIRETTLFICQFTVRKVGKILCKHFCRVWGRRQGRKQSWIQREVLYIDCNYVRVWG
jgi:hypothetical protein